MDIVTNWQSSHALPSFSLRGTQVDVWRTPVDLAHHPLVFFRSFLSPDEITRADQFKNASAHRQFVVTRCMLRHLLGRYAGVPPIEIQLKKTPQGKPFPVFPHHVTLQCNVSHTQGMALVAISGGPAVGIDVETVDRTINAEELAQRFFSACEAQHLAEVGDDQRAWWFLTYWTCKEAFLKMQGTGLSADLSEYEIEFNPGGPATRVKSRLSHNSHTPYFLSQLNPGTGFVGAIAVEAASPEITYFDWNPDALREHVPF